MVILASKNTIHRAAWSQLKILREMGPWPWTHTVHPKNYAHSLHFCWSLSLKWCHNEHDGISNHQFLVFFSSICSGTDQRKYQSSTSLAFERGIHWWPVDSIHKGPVTQKMFPIDDIFMSTNDFIHILQGHLYWHRGSHTTIPDLVKQSWTIWVKTHMKSPRTDLTTTKQSKTKHDDDMVWKHYPHYLPSADSSYKGPVMGSFDVFFVISLNKMSNSQVVGYRAHSVYVPSQWEMALHCNAISHWLGAYTEWSLG